MGREVTVIMGARSKDLLILQEQFKALPLKNLFMTTDDGTIGEKGVVTQPLERILQDNQIDECFCVGPVPMMKFCALTAEKYNTPIIASLNPLVQGHCFTFTMNLVCPHRHFSSQREKLC